jgi:NAD-dependent SIR2 family protein deacetylase
MTEEILRILLSDLSTVRITCAKCSVVTELPTSKLPTAFELHKRCPHCQQELSPGLLRAFTWFGEGIAELSRDDMKQQATIEFVSRIPARP